MVCDRLSVETPSRAARSARGWIRNSGRSSEVSRNHVGELRNPLHLVREFAGDIADDVAVGAGHDQLHRALAVLVEEPEPDIRHVFEILADRQLELALRDRCVASWACN